MMMVFLVQRPEHVRITDFGLAKLLDNKAALFSTTGEKVTTTLYFHTTVIFINENKKIEL